MTLHNYWWLLIWMFTGGALMTIFPKKVEWEYGKRELRWTLLPAIIMVVPYIVWASGRKGFADTEMYRKTFLNAPSTLTELPSYLSGVTKDRGFYGFEVVLKCIIGNHDKVFFLVLAAIQILLLVYVYRKYSCNYWLSIFIFVASTDYLSWIWNGSRQFLAVTVILGATPFLIKKRFVPLIAIILVAATLHASALLMIPIVFIIQGKAWNKRTILAIIVSIVALVFVEQFTNILDTLLAETQFENVVSDWQAWGDDGMNPIRALVYSVPTIVSLFGIRWIRLENDPVINMAVNAGVMTTALSIIAVGTSGIFIGRLPIYTSLYSNGILLPWLIDHMFEKKSATMIKVLAVIGYSLFFYFQMHFTWSLI